MISIGNNTLYLDFSKIFLKIPKKQAFKPDKIRKYKKCWQNTSKYISLKLCTLKHLDISYYYVSFPPD